MDSDLKAIFAILSEKGSDSPIPLYYYDDPASEVNPLVQGLLAFSLRRNLKNSIPMGERVLPLRETI